MREAIRPLDREHATVQFFESQIVGCCSFQAIQIGVIESQPSASILMHQREGGAADVFGIESKTLREPSHKRRLPSPEISG